MNELELLKAHVGSIKQLHATYIDTKGGGGHLPPLGPSSLLSTARTLTQLYLPFEKINYNHGKKGQLGACFREAFNEARRKPSYVYCEGYAIASPGAPIPLSHAWCYDLETQEVIDTVWCNDKVKGVAYCGLPFQDKFSLEFILASKHYGIVDSIWRFKQFHSYKLSDIVHPAFHHLIQ